MDDEKLPTTPAASVSEQSDVALPPPEKTDAQQAGSAAFEEPIPMPDLQGRVPSVLADQGWAPSALRLVKLVCLALIFSSTMVVACQTKTSAVRNTNVGSRYGQVEGLVNHGTYAITKTRYRRTIDKVKYKGEDISSKPPLLPTVAAGVYWVYRAFTGYDIRTDEKKVVRFCNWVLGALLHLVMLIFWLRFLLLITSRPEVVVLGVAMLAFGFLGMGYAIELNNHSVAACLTMVGFYFAFRIRNELDARTYHWVISGFLLGILPAVDVPSALTSAGIFVYLATYDWKKTLTLWVPVSLIGPTIALSLNYYITDSILPVQLQPALKKGTYWANPKGVDALREPKNIYAFNVLVGHHGIFTMTPVLIFAGVWIYRNIRYRIRYFAETIFIGVVTTFLIAWYIRSTNNYGGNCVGFRWAIAWTPLLFALVAFHLSTIQLRFKQVLLVCIGTGVTSFHIWQCFWTPWHVSAWERFCKTVIPAWLGG